MALTVPTVKINAPGGGFLIINKCDFNAKTDTLYEEKKESDDPIENLAIKLNCDLDLVKMNKFDLVKTAKEEFGVKLNMRYSVESLIGQIMELRKLKKEQPKPDFTQAELFDSQATPNNIFEAAQDSASEQEE